MVEEQKDMFKERCKNNDCMIVVYDEGCTSISVFDAKLTIHAVLAGAARAFQNVAVLHGSALSPFSCIWLHT